MPRYSALLVVVIVFCAIAVINVRHYSRLMYAELQQLKAERDALNVEWGKLLLEEGAWAQNRRVEAAARQRLGMALPLPEQVMIVHTRGHH